jgi:hypothetical protein
MHNQGFATNKPGVLKMQEREAHILNGIAGLEFLIRCYHNDSRIPEWQERIKELRAELQTIPECSE